ncbi:MAG: hypothetical protein LBN94_01110 [Puniceicoccales bacterium]|nr:hypothetical protein [Puniceicoccales bacterium]
MGLFSEHGVEARPSHVSVRHRSPFPKEKNRNNRNINPLVEVVISEKRNRDFEYFPGILGSFLGKTYPLNHAMGKQYRRYILREKKEMTEGKGNSEGKLSGVYAIILLGDSLKNWMGRGTITLKYIRYGSLEIHALHFPIEERDVADDGQIFILLDPERKNRKKFIAWKVTLQDTDSHISFSKASFNWKTLKQNR